MIFICSASVFYGDINADGNIDSSDLALIKRSLLGTIKLDSSGISAADVNGDSILDSTDMAFIKRYILGIITVFPASQTPYATPVFTPSPIVTPTPYSTIFQAENALIGNGIAETVNTGYTGNSYVNYDNVTGSYIEWTVDIKSSGNQTLKFRYSNGTTSDRPMEISVNGNIINKSLSFNSTANWTTWSEVSILGNLNSGINTVRATATTSNGGPNLDYIQITNAVEPSIKPTPSPTPQATPTVTSDTLTSATVYLCGDSTVQTYNASYKPQAGWGQMIYQYFTPNITFVNRAIGGRSSKNFVEQGRLDEILNVIKKNDYLFVQFGHNDATINNPDRYAAPYTTYKEYLKKYIAGAREKGAIPVLITPVGRLNYKNNVFVNDFPDYCTAMKQVATEENVKLIDLMTLSLSHFTSVGYNETYTYFLVSSNGTDYTHFTEKGAKVIAEIVAKEVKKLNLPLSSCVK